MMKKLTIVLAIILFAMGLINLHVSAADAVVVLDDYPQSTFSLEKPSAEEIAAVVVLDDYPPSASRAASSELDPWSFLLNPDRDYANTIVNWNHPYEFGGAYDTALQADLVYVMDDVYGDTLIDTVINPDLTTEDLERITNPDVWKRNAVRVEKATYFAYTRLKAELKKTYGIDIGLLGSTAGYRTAEDQQEIHDAYGGIEPGLSDHHAGLTLSVVFYAPDPDDPSHSIWQVPTVDFAAAHRDLIEPFLRLLPECGFIVRYPPGKEEFTFTAGIYRDIRFVGTSHTAKLLTAIDMCLEEAEFARGAQ